jgi:hypothetical protein
MSTNPWDTDFTPAAVDADLVKDVEAAVAAGETVVTQVVPAAAPVISDATQAVESVITGGGGTGATATAASSTTTVIPSTTPTITGDITQDLEAVIEAAAKGSAKSALSSLAPALEAELAKEFQATVEKVVNRATGGTDTAPVPNLTDFIHADARSRAFRTLLVGLGVAILTGLGTVAGQLVGTDWSTHNGQVAAVTIAAGAVATSVGTYFTRLVSEPQVTKPLTAQLPAKSA